MDGFWQIVIGTGIGGVLCSIYSLYKQYMQESKTNNEKQTLAIWSIMIGLSGILLAFIGSILGIILALLSMRGKNHRALSKIGLLISMLTLLPWFLVVFIGT